MQHQKISIGFSPCPNDTYMFAALVNGWIDTHGLAFSASLEDVETLNERASESFYDVTKLSFHRAMTMGLAYSLLSSGAALGHGCGPLLIARRLLSQEEIENGTIALPGKWTTAHLLFRIFFPSAIYKHFYPFHQIEELVLSEEVTAGVIIHENRFTYQDKGLIKITDLGETWETLTGMPIPLGGIFASSSLSGEVVLLVEQLIRDSILFAHQHPDRVMPYVRQYAREMDESVMKSHIDLYVNEFSLELGETGQNAVRQLKKMIP